MERNKEQSISEALKLLFKTYKLDQKMAEAELLAKLPDVVGVGIAKYIKSSFIKDRKLFLSVHSSIVKNELHLVKSGLIQKLNQSVGRETINDIYLM